MENAKEHLIDEKQLVVFNLADEEFGVDIDEVKEIIKPSDITRVPNCDEYIHGIINLRGKIIVVLDLAKRLGLIKKDFDKDTRIIVLEVNGINLGVLVDRSQEVLRIKSNNIESANGVLGQKVSKEFIKGVCVIGQRLIILLDSTKIV